MSRPLPRIQINKRQLRDITSDSLVAIRDANQPPSVFQRGGVLARLLEHEETLRLDVFDDDSLSGHLARIADWVRLDPWGNDVPTMPPLRVAKTIRTLGQWARIPYLDRIIEAPTFSRDESLIVKPGYHSGARLLYRPSGNLAVEPPPIVPSRAQIEEARQVIDELLCDLPFDRKGGKAHAVAAILLPFVRELIEGVTPLHLIDAPSPGTGKGLLAEVIAIPALGHGPSAITEGRSEEEWRKRITALLIQAGSYVLVDNIRSRLDSAAQPRRKAAGSSQEPRSGTSKAESRLEPVGSSP